MLIYERLRMAPREQLLGRLGEKDSNLHLLFQSVLARPISLNPLALVATFLRFPTFDHLDLYDLNGIIWWQLLETVDAGRC
jgi:hypothetical protein